MSASELEAIAYFSAWFFAGGFFHVLLFQKAAPKDRPSLWVTVLLWPLFVLIYGVMRLKNNIKKDYEKK